jgi:hypothetical protein
MKGHTLRYFNAISYREKKLKIENLQLIGLMKKNPNFDHSKTHKLFLV